MKQKLQQLQQDNSNRPNEYNPIIPTNQLQQHLQPQQPSPTQTQTTPTTIGVQFGKKEETIRSKAKRTKLKILSIFIKSNIASILVFIFYLITLETILSCLLTVGLMLYWYFYALGLFGTVPDGWSGGGIDWVVLGFGTYVKHVFTCLYTLLLPLRILLIDALFIVFSVICMYSCCDTYYCINRYGIYKT